jgi:hypothetical protein
MMSGGRLAYFAIFAHAASVIGPSQPEGFRLIAILQAPTASVGLCCFIAFFTAAFTLITLATDWPGEAMTRASAINIVILSISADPFSVKPKKKELLRAFAR